MTRTETASIDDPEEELTAAREALTALDPLVATADEYGDARHRAELAALRADAARRLAVEQAEQQRLSRVYELCAAIADGPLHDEGRRALVGYDAAVDTLVAAVRGIEQWEQHVVEAIRQLIVLGPAEGVEAARRDGAHIARLPNGTVWQARPRMAGDFIVAAARDAATRIGARPVGLPTSGTHAATTLRRRLDRAAR